jgi:hypothetical protein
MDRPAKAPRYDLVHRDALNRPEMLAFAKHGLVCRPACLTESTPQSWRTERITPPLTAHDGYPALARRPLTWGLRYWRSCAGARVGVWVAVWGWLGPDAG